MYLPSRLDDRAPRILKRKCHGSILILIELLVKGLSYNLLIFYFRSYLKTISARYCFEIARRTMMPMINRPRSKSECATANVFRHFLKIMKIHKELFRGNKMRYLACSSFLYSTESGVSSRGLREPKKQAQNGRKSFS